MHRAGSASDGRRRFPLSRAVPSLYHSSSSERQSALSIVAAVAIIDIDYSGRDLASECGAAVTAEPSCCAGVYVDAGIDYNVILEAYLRVN